ncbi:MAG: T9SS type A sorting domain-containing protein [Bacteroidia bacterium]|nr:T9SS type A sorting domain-containing protein [Bacteroidia bacterium]
MKKLITLILVLSAWSSFAQLTLVKETDKGFAPFLLSNGKWMLYDDVEKGNYDARKLQSITFYNPDYSVYKVLNIPQKFPFDTTGYKNSIELYDIEQSNGVDNDYYFTDNFFNLDSKIEVIIKYSSQMPNSNNQKESLLIINEDGDLIQKFDNLNGGIWINYWKYFVVAFESNVEGLESQKIYSVPGNLPCPFTCGQKAASIAPITQPNEFKEIQVNGFPNPSSDKVTLAYALPEGVAFGTLRLYTQTGELVKEFKVSSQVDHLELPVSEYTPGTYYYELQAGGSTSGGKKMVVIH